MTRTSRTSSYEYEYELYDPYEFELHPSVLGCKNSYFFIVSEYELYELYELVQIYEFLVRVTSFDFSKIFHNYKDNFQNFHLRSL